MRTNIVKCLDKKVKQQIYNAWNDSNVTKTALAKSFDVSVRTIGRVLIEMDTPTKDYEWDYCISKSEITILKDGVPRSVDKSFPSFSALKTSLIEEGFEESILSSAYDAMCMKQVLETFSEGNITVDHENSVMKYGSFEIKHSLVDRVFGMLDNMKDAKSTVLPMVRFLDKLMENPDDRIVEQLYPFMEHNDIVISEEGDIIAYRSITRDWKDHHTKSISNKIGEVVKMPRSMVNDDANVTCSTGLHVAAYDYASSFGGANRLVKVKVHPKNICSVPVDYNGQKMRCCEFEILEEVK